MGCGVHTTYATLLAARAALHLGPCEQTAGAKLSKNLVGPDEGSRGGELPTLPRFHGVPPMASRPSRARAGRRPLASRGRDASASGRGARAGALNLTELRFLLRLLREHDLEEVEIEEGGRRIRLRRRVASPVSAGPDAPPVQPLARPAAQAPPAAVAVGPPPPTITAPMVGTFYRAPAPGAEPFVKEGDLVEKGTVVGIIEAMKLMNEIEAEVRGRIAAILVENGHPVEYGQPLFALEPL